MKRLFTAVLIVFGLLGFFLWAGAAAAKAQWCPYCDLTGSDTSSCSTNSTTGDTTCTCKGNGGGCGARCPGGYYPCNRDNSACCETDAKQHTFGAKRATCPDGATPTMKGYLGCVQSKYCGPGRYHTSSCFRNARDMDDGEPSGIKCYAGYTCPSSCNATAPSNVAVKQRLPKQRLPKS